MATQLGAEHLILLTDIDGVYDADPRTNPEAKRLTEMLGVTAKQVAAAGGAGARGRGGMRSKLEAARLAGRSMETTGSLIPAPSSSTSPRARSAHR